MAIRVGFRARFASRAAAYRDRMTRMSQPSRIRLSTMVALCLLWLPAAAAGQASIFSDGKADARMARALEAYERIVAEGGWPAVPAGPALRRGAVDDRVIRLRARLVASGDLPVALRAGRTFDRLLQRAVRRFQVRHGLLVDGIVGRVTLAALNVSATRRHETLSINRRRLGTWRAHIAGDGVVVNIPDASLELLENGRRVLRSTVVVGRPSWPTPVLHSAIFAIDVNPVWYVPARIAQHELLPRARSDPGYLKSLNIRVFASDADGRPSREVSYREIDFTRADKIGYRLRQDAGLGNALGAVKFVFDNPYSVFLHDTPHKEFFSRTERSLSHGCVRVAAALDLARHFAAGDPNLGVEALETAIAAGKTQRLLMNRPVPIHVVYLTAWVDRRGRAQFRHDIYRRDRRDGGADPALAACGGDPRSAGPAG